MGDCSISLDPSVVLPRHPWASFFRVLNGYKAENLGQKMDRMNDGECALSSSSNFSVPELSVHFFVAGPAAIRRKDGGLKNTETEK